MNTTMRNCALGMALAMTLSGVSAATMDVKETLPGAERVATLPADGVFRVIYTLDVCPLHENDILVITAQSQVQNSAVDHGIYFAARLRRDTAESINGIDVDNQGNGMNIAAHDYRLVSPKVTISRVGSSLTERNSCVINYIGRADDEGQGGSMSVVNNRGRLQVLKITP